MPRHDQGSKTAGPRVAVAACRGWQRSSEADVRRWFGAMASGSPSRGSGMSMLLANVTVFLLAPALCRACTAVCQWRREIQLKCVCCKVAFWEEGDCAPHCTVGCVICLPSGIGPILVPPLSVLLLQTYSGPQTSTAGKPPLPP